MRASFDTLLSDPFRRRIALAWIGSFLIFAAFPIFRFTHPSRTLSGWTDHYSHWGAAILMAFDGFDVYRQPVKQLCDAPTPAQHAENPLSDCTLRAHPSIHPFAVNWQKYPRVYPPGAMLFGAPEALLFGTSLLRFEQVNLLIVLQCLLFAHLASLALFLCLWRREASDEGSGWSSVVLFILVPLAHLALVEGAVRGMYDPVAISGVIFGALLLSRNQPVPALVALSLAVFTHFRALWYLPLLGLALWRVYATRREWVASRSRLALVVVACGLLGVSFYCFVTLLPALRTFPLTNPAGWKAFTVDPGLVFSYGLPVAGVLAVLLRNRNWMTAAVVSWQLFMLLQTREVQQWHALFVLPMLAVAATERRGAAAAVVATFVLFIWESRVVFSGWPITGDLIADLLRT